MNNAAEVEEHLAALIAHVRLHLTAPSGEYICTCRGTRGECWYCVAREMVSG